MAVVHSHSCCCPVHVSPLLAFCLQLLPPEGYSRAGPSVYPMGKPLLLSVLPSSAAGPSQHSTRSYTCSVRLFSCWLCSLFFGLTRPFNGATCYCSHCKLGSDPTSDTSVTMSVLNRCTNLVNEHFHHSKGDWLHNGIGLLICQWECMLWWITDNWWQQRVINPCV